MSRFARAAKGSEWVGLGEASRLLGVAPGTLRRWSDAGRVRTFTTPGGHRRYRREALERLLPADRHIGPLLVHSGVTRGRLTRAYRREARKASRHFPWLLMLTDEQREWFRVHGRRLAEVLVQYLEEEAEDGAQENLAAATSEAAAYGRRAAGMGISLSQTVEGFLQFRRPFLHELGLFAGRRGLDTSSTTELMESAERAMDRLLMATLSAHSIERGASRLPPEPDAEGLT